MVTIVGQRRGAKLWRLSVSVLKPELDHLLFQGEEGFPPGYCHFPSCGPEYFKQLRSEPLVSKVHKGYPKREWHKICDRIP